MVFPPLHNVHITNPFSSTSQKPIKSLITPQNQIKLGITPTTKSLNLLLSFLLHSHKLHLILHSFSQFSPNSIQPNSNTHSLVSLSLLHSLRSPKAQHLLSFCHQEFNFTPGNRLWNSIIKTQENPEIAFLLLKECVRDCNVVPSLGTFRSLVYKFCSQGEVDNAIEVFEEMTRGENGYPVDDFVCSAIVSGFSRSGRPELGLDFYAKVEGIVGFCPNLVTCTAVVDALCRRGGVDEACLLVRRMEEKGMALDAALYNSLICGYFDQGMVIEALRKHKLMVEKGIVPDVVSYTTLVDGFCLEGNVEKAIGFLNEMKKRRILPNLFTYTALIRGFCMKGKLAEAFCVLRKMEDLGVSVDEFAYSILIDGLCRNGDLDHVFTLLEEMERKGIQAGPVTYNTVANGLCKVGKTSKASEICKDYFADNFTYSTLLHGYMKEMNAEGVVDIKRRLEDCGICLDVVTCNVLIKALFMVGMVEDACMFYQEMPKMGAVANVVTYCTMVDGLCRRGMINKALEIFEECRKIACFSNASCHECIIRWLCKENMIEIAMEVFDDIIDRGHVCVSATYRKLIKAQYQVSSGEGILGFIHRIERLKPELLSSISSDAVTILCRKCCYESAFDVFLFTRSRGCSIENKAYYLLLKNLNRSGNDLIIELLICDYVKAYGTLEPRIKNILCVYLCRKNVGVAIEFLADMKKNDIFISTFTAVVSTLKKEGRIYDAHHNLLEAEEKGLPLDVVIYSIVVDGLCKEGYLENALDLCTSMKKMGIHPNCVIYNSIINGLCRQGCLVEAMRIFDSLESSGVVPTVITYATLIGALSREGFLEDASQLFDRMVDKGIPPNTRTYNLLIYGYCSFGLIDEALKVMSDLEKSGLQQDSFTISTVISGFCLKGEMEGALSFFNDYKKRAFCPDFVGFVNLIKGLFTKGRMEEARTILKEMLQCTAVVDLINSAGNELRVDSLASLLDLACQQGRIQEAIYVLDEVGSVAFSSWRSNDSIRFTKLQKLLESGSMDEVIGTGGICPLALKVPRKTSQCMAADIPDTDHAFYKIMREDICKNDNEFLLGESSCYEFDTYYTIIASLCSKGEMQKANIVVRAMLPN